MTGFFASTWPWYREIRANAHCFVDGVRLFRNLFGMATPAPRRVSSGFWSSAKLCTARGGVIMTWWIIYLTGSQKHVKISTRQIHQFLIVWSCYDFQADKSCRKELVIQISTGPIRTICDHMSYATHFGEFVASERCRINVCENAA